jgi:Tfp pilus assembly PilM family ATPase
MADKKSIVTLDIGSQRVTMARFSLSKGSLILHDYAYRYLVGDPAADSARIPQVSAAIKELASTLKLSGSDVYYTISGHAVFTRFVTFPEMEGSGLDQVVELKLNKMFLSQLKRLRGIIKKFLPRVKEMIRRWKFFSLPSKMKP